MHRILFPATLILIAGCLGAGAKDLKILTGAGMSMPVRQMAQEFAARTGTKVDVVSDTAGGVQKRVESGEKRAAVIRRLITRRLNQCPDARIDYVSIVDSETLRPLKTITAPATAAIAVFFGKTRLIDNIQLC